MAFVLGSGSSRRLELLARIGAKPDSIQVPDIDETPGASELPRIFCARMAREKIAAIQAGRHDVVLCADTVVALGRRILGKPGSAGHAEQMLRMLSGRRHQVLTAIAVRRDRRQWERLVVSKVRMKRLSELEIVAYVASGEWKDKAGGYAIQGLASTFIPWISGSFTGIVGLPLTETANLLRSAGMEILGTET